jgi:hypothetical protein
VVPDAASAGATAVTTDAAIVATIAASARSLRRIRTPIRALGLTDLTLFQPFLDGEVLVVEQEEHAAGAVIR